MPLTRIEKSMPGLYRAIGAMHTRQSTQDTLLKIQCSCVHGHQCHLRQQFSEAAIVPQPTQLHMHIAMQLSMHASCNYGHSNIIAFICVYNVNNVVCISHLMVCKKSLWGANHYNHSVISPLECNLSHCVFTV